MDIEVQKDYSPCIDDDSLQYITSGYSPVKRYIVCAANRHKSTGVMLIGSRHWSKAMHQQCDMMNLDDKQFEQGFIDQYDQFLNREDAKRIAIKNGQKLIGKDWGVLYSENLY